MTNNLTGLVALVGGLTALVTAITTLILHLRSQSNVKSQKAASTIQSLGVSTNANDLQSENKPYQPGQ